MSYNTPSSAASAAIQCDGGGTLIRLGGTWDTSHLVERVRDLDQLGGGRVPARAIDLSGVERLDAAGARLVRRIAANPIYCIQQPYMERLLAAAAQQPPPSPPKATVSPLATLGQSELVFLHHMAGVLALLGRTTLDLVATVLRPLRFPWLELSANLFRAGVKALPLLGLVALLIGVVLSYLGMQQLVDFGATLFIVDLLGMGIFREFGPVLAAILVAGRSGAAMAAQIGVMQITNEIDALKIMGISPTVRLALPKILALIIIMPLLVFWTDVIALFAGSVVADVVYNYPLGEFYRRLPSVVSLTNLAIGLAKGALFGATIGLVACYFGFRVRPDSGSLGQMTTAAVVTGITLIIVLDAVLAILLSDVG